MPNVPAAVLLASCLGLILAVATPARAADAARQEGLALRLVAERPSEDGRFRAALRIDLEPGWKTYWLDPGEAGIPPSLDFSSSNGIEAVAAHFPAPHRFDDGFSKSNVYSEPLAVAIDGRAVGAGGRLDLKLTLGICRDICIPVSAELQADVGSGPVETGSVAAAFAALPKASTAEAGIVGATLSADETSLAITVRPADVATKANLFVAGTGGWSFGAPSAAALESDAATLTVPVTAKPRRKGVPPRIDAILTAPDGAWRADDLAIRPGKD